MRIISTLILVISFLVLSACSTEKEETLNKYINKDVDKVEILNGENGEQVVITGTNEINKIVQYLESISASPSSNKDLKGYSYKIDLINKNETVNTITFMGDILKIDNEYYESKNEINTNILKDLMTKK